MSYTSKKTIVFGGPSISQDLRKCFPNFLFKGPAQQGDIYQAAEFGNCHQLILLDGYYKSVPAVWHKEIIYALNKGIIVVGSSSLGALRAVELEPYGMKGYGKIFSWYRSGLLTRDPDVAVVHTSDHDDYRTLTIPIVNILASLEESSAPISDSIIGSVLELSRSIYFENRTLSALLNRIRDSDLIDCHKDQVLDILTNRYVDQKFKDSEATLKWVAATESFTQEESKEPLSETIYWDALVVNDSYISPNSSGLLSSRQALLTFQLLQKPQDFMRMRERAITIELCLWLGSLYGINADPKSVNRIRDQLLENLGIDAEKLEMWLHSRSISNSEFTDFLNACAIEREVRDRVQYRSPYCAFNRIHYGLLALHPKSEEIYKTFQEFHTRLSDESLSAVDEISETNDFFPAEAHNVMEQYRLEMILKKNPDSVAIITKLPVGYIMAFAKLHGRFISIIKTMLSKLFAVRNES